MLVRTLEHGKRVIRRLNRNPWVATDTETIPTLPYRTKTDKKAALVYGRRCIVAVTFCYKGEAYSFLTSDFNDKFPTLHEWNEVFRPLFINSGCLKIMHNCLYDQNTFEENGSAYDDWQIYDTAIGAWLADENRKKALKERAPIFGHYLQQTSVISFTDETDLALYVEGDGIVTDELYQAQQYGYVERVAETPHLNAKGKIEFVKNPMPSGRLMFPDEKLSRRKKHVFTLQEMPCERSAIRAQRRGFPIIRKRLHKLRKVVHADSDKAKKKLYHFAGEVFNPNSPKQVVGIFNKLGIPIMDRTTSGNPSVGIGSLHKSLGTHPIVDALIKSRGVDTLIKNYAGQVEPKCATKLGTEYFINPVTERVHASINTTGAITGRSSCSNPNMQQIPSRKDTYGIKNVFAIQKLIRRKLQRMLIVLDYTQLEIRVQVMGSKEPRMLEVLRDPKGDIHTTTAEEFNVDRSPTAKELNFLLQYAGGNWMLSEKLTFEGIPTTKEEAQGYIDTYDRIYAGVAPWRQTLLDQQRTKGSVFLLTGRKRGLPDVDWNDKRSVHKAETTLSNNVVQGSGQDLLKASIVRLDVDEINPDKEILKTNMTSSMDNVHKALVSDYAVKLEKVRRALRKSKTEWLMQVHDETLYESNACDALEMAHMIAEVMGWRHYFPPPKGFFEYNVPLLAEGGVGYSWKEAKSSEEVKSPFIIPA